LPEINNKILLLPSSTHWKLIKTKWESIKHINTQTAIKQYCQITSNTTSMYAHDVHKTIRKHIILNTLYSVTSVSRFTSVDISDQCDPIYKHCIDCMNGQRRCRLKYKIRPLHKTIIPGLWVNKQCYITISHVLQTPLHQKLMPRKQAITCMPRLFNGDEYFYIQNSFYNGLKSPNHKWTRYVQNGRNSPHYYTITCWQLWPHLWFSNVCDQMNYKRLTNSIGLISTGRDQTKINTVH